MKDMTLLNEALALALKLSPKERIQLIEQVASSVERDIESPPSSEEHWGQKLNALLDTLDMSDWETIAFDDPAAWVEQQCAEEQQRRLGDWGEEA